MRGCLLLRGICRKVIGSSQSPGVLPLIGKTDGIFISGGGIGERGMTVELLSSSLGSSPGTLGSWKEGLGERSCLIYVKYV